MKHERFTVSRVPFRYRDLYELKRNGKKIAHLEIWGSEVRVRPLVEGIVFSGVECRS